jgi:alpha-tubulin suppressor-like RCC1 family protein
MPLRVDAKPFAALAVGGDLTCGLQASGLAWCWGAGNTTPARVPAKEHFSLLAVGLAGGAGVTAKGRTYWWHNPFVGTGTVVRDIDPAQRGLIRSVETHYTMVGIGATHVCGLTKDGTVYCWGDHSRGQLGRGDNWLGDLVAEAIVDELIPGVDDEADTVDPRDTLVHENTIRNADWRTIDRVPTRVRFEAIAAGYLHTCGLTSGGRVFCWGSNDEGQLGSANPELAYEPRETQPIEPDP